MNIECILSWLVFHKVNSLVVPYALCCRLYDPDVIIRQLLLSSFFPVQPASMLLHADCHDHYCMILANFMHWFPFIHTSLLMCPSLSMILALLLILACVFLLFLQYINASGTTLPPGQYSWLITSCPSWYPVLTFICPLPCHHCCHAESEPLLNLVDLEFVDDWRQR